MLVFANPDDETIGLGARLSRYASAVIVHITDGAPRNTQELRAHGFTSREAYAAHRSRELQLALELAGLRNVHRISFHLPDQEVSLHLAELIGELRELLKVHTPQVVFTHPYEGGHPDHDACAFAVQRAISLSQSTQDSSPLIIEPAFYHLGSEGIETGCFLRKDEPAEEITWPLSPQERRHKQELLKCFGSQQDMLRYFPPSHERFRVAPNYDFTEPPHAGRVFYEHFEWGMTAQRFCELTRMADVAEGIWR